MDESIKSGRNYGLAECVESWTDADFGDTCHLCRLGETYCVTTGGLVGSDRTRYRGPDLDAARAAFARFARC